MKYLEVTQEDIDKALAERDDLAGLSCPIAQALRRQFETRLVFAGTDWLRVQSGDAVKRFTPTTPIRRFMRQFDAGKPVAPHRFALRRLRP